MGKSTSCDKSGLKKGPWTAEEDQKLIDYIQKHGQGRWRTLPKSAGLKRCGKSCRLRWINYLRPDIKRGKFSLEEEETIIQLHGIMGNKWSTIAAQLPGRTDNEIKNYWNTHLKKRLLGMGIDPVTHKPRLDLVQLYSVLNSSLCNTSQLNHFPSLLPNGSMLNPSLTNSFTSLLSCKGSSQDFSPKKFPDYHLGDAQMQVQNPSATLQTNHFHDQMEAYSNSPSAQLISQPQLMHSNLEQICSDPTSINHQNPLQGLWQANRQLTNIADSFTPNCGYQNSPQTIIHAKSAENVPNFGLTSLLSRTSWSTTTPLNSSSTYVNGNNEDERGCCSNMLIFDNIPNSLAVSGLI